MTTIEAQSSISTNDIPLPDSIDPAVLVAQGLADFTPERERIRRQAVDDARVFVESRLGTLTPDDTRELLRLFNVDHHKGRTRADRFAPGFVGALANDIAASTEALNQWLPRLWSAVDDEAIATVLDDFWAAKDVPGAGRSLPTMLLHVREPERHFPLMAGLAKGYAVLTGASARGRRGATYLEYARGLVELRKTHDIPVHATDLVLMEAARTGASEASSADKRAAPNRILAALPDFDRGQLADHLAAGERERADLLERFPRERWPSMTVEDYAVGQGNEDAFCYRMEFVATHLGSIRGGTARKHIIFRRNDGEWFVPEMFADLDEAWTAIRKGFQQAFALADQGRWEEIDAIESISWAPALTVKTLHLYFPSEILPIASRAHLQHFLGVLGCPEAADPSYDVVRFNRVLLGKLRAQPQLEGWSTGELERLLYSAADPRESKRVLKVAPGHDAERWEECRDGGFICVGWDEVGDLGRFESKAEFRQAFEEACTGLYSGRRNTISRKANELWRLRELEPGDLVFANRGTSEILAVGTVVEPGYEYRGDRESFRQCVHVEWDESYRQTIEPQKGWAMVTVAEVPSLLYERVLATARRVEVPVERTLSRLAETLERKGQVVLYGPPGTGKTRMARRFAVWWLRKHAGDHQPALPLSDPEEQLATERALSMPRVDEDSDEVELGPLTRVTFHASYAYEDFIEGYRPVPHGEGMTLRLEDGIFKRVCMAARRHPDRRYLVLVDELNRANVAKVFGELLTLLERDKRGLTITLPLSKQAFEIPPNVYLLGTMNTADRSIKVFDAALRRRFAFVELMPDPALLEGVTIGNLALDEFLVQLNQRVVRREGREKQIGHSYLLSQGKPIEDADALARVFHEEILPLLQEYCYEDYRALAEYLGEGIVDSDNRRLRDEILDDPERLLSVLEREFGASNGSEAASES